MIVYTFGFLSDILSDLFISNSTLFIVLAIGSILIIKVNVSGLHIKSNGINSGDESGNVVDNMMLTN